MLALRRLEELSETRRGGSQTEIPTTTPPISHTTASAPPKRKSTSTSPRKPPRDPSVFPWEFSEQELERFPALRKRNFFCIQRHQARALHYDLRLQMDGGTLSWALPKGLIGMSKKGQSSHMAVQTTVHPISYSTHEGNDGTVFSGGRRAGTLLWDIGEYEIGDSSSSSPESGSAENRRRKRRKLSPDEEDPLGRHEEDKLRDRFGRKVPSGHQRTIRLTLKNGRKMTNHSFILVLDVQNARSLQYGRGGHEKKSWFVRLPSGIDGYPWEQGGEDGDFWGRSVKSGLTFAEVCSAPPNPPVMFASELRRYEGWSEAKGDDGWEDEAKFAVKVVEPK